MKKISQTIVKITGLILSMNSYSSCNLGVDELKSDIQAHIIALKTNPRLMKEIDFHKLNTQLAIHHKNPNELLKIKEELKNILFTGNGTACQC